MDLTPEQLKKYNGKNGQPAYVAVDGQIYDVSSSSMWPEGEHFTCYLDALAGKDLTEALKDAPHTKSNLDPFPIVGRLIE